MNSDNSEDSVLPTDSSSPAVFQVKAGATTILDLEDDELPCYDYLCESWKKEKTIYKKTVKNLMMKSFYLPPSMLMSVRRL